MQVLPIKCWSGILKPAEMILAINVPATKIIAPCIKVCFLFFCKNSTPFFGIPARLLVYIVFCRASPAEKLPQGKLAAGQQFHTDMGIAPHCDWGDTKTGSHKTACTIFTYAKARAVMCPVYSSEVPQAEQNRSSRLHCLLQTGQVMVGFMAASWARSPSICPCKASSCSK